MWKIIINLIVGGAFIGIGFYAFIWKTESILGIFGRLPFFEKYLGAEGGTRLGYKLIGIVIIFIGLLLAFNMFDRFTLWAISPLTRYNNQPVQEQRIIDPLD
jgi:hypothetical protein